MQNKNNRITFVQTLKRNEMSKISINYKGVNLDIEYDHQPEEKPERGPEAMYAGCNESFEIEEIKHKGVCFLDVFENDLDEIEEIIRSNW